MEYQPIIDGLRERDRDHRQRYYVTDALSTTAADVIEKLITPAPEAISRELAPLGGILRCEVCGTTRALGNVGSHLSHGWPTHCGYTMMWWTQRQIDAGEMPAEPTSSNR